ncbi:MULTISPECIES: ArsA family ATPase [unclassified Kitasatospora]|uniref:ArsA family ATPase n=1 Tax=unclassified Kitasatospora TaxID=2633591 RepID=UPI0024745E02|nr:ArsA-related P-loop ATPase [Kitasatospora sp. MAP12-44]
MTRTVLVTGDGAGVAEVAAATALHAAERGLRTLLVAADDPHRRIDGLFGSRLTAVPEPVAGNLWATRIDEQHAFRRAVAGLDGPLRSGYDLLGVEPLDEDELTALPGTGHLALLRALRQPAGEWDVLVAAAPPPAELTAALALPEQLDRYLARLLPEQRQAAHALRPMLAALVGMPMPADWIYKARGWAAVELAAAREVVESPATSVRLVADAGSFTADGLHRARAGLALFGHRVDAVVAHRALPAAALGSPDPWLAALAVRERERLDGLGLDVPLLIADQLAEELPALARQLYGTGAGPEPTDGWPWTAEDRLAEDGVLLWRLAVPGADRADLELMRRGDELVVGLGPYRRILPLPSALRRCTVAGAGLRDGELTVRFAPDPELWPRS